MWKNCLGISSGEMFAQSLKENKSLKFLNLYENSITFYYLELITNYVSRNNMIVKQNHVLDLKRES